MRGTQKYTRWIKYEEDIEDGSGRWGQPYVSSLSYHSVAKLRDSLNTAILLLDLETSDMNNIMKSIVGELNGLGQQQKENLLR